MRYYPHEEPLPEPEPVVVKRLSLDAMIGIFCMLFVFALSGYTINFVIGVGGIALIIWAWRKLKRVAPVTAQVIAIIFMVILSALLSRRTTAMLN